MAESLDRADKNSLYRQLYENLRQAILARRLPGGARLPASRSLAAALNISRNTVTTAYDQLIAEGYLVGKTGAGTFVADELFEDELIFAKTGSRPKKNAKLHHRLSRRGAVLAKTSVSFSPEPKKPRAFQPGFSAIDEFPLDIWTRILTKRLRRLPRTVLDYGETGGFPPLREAIADYLGTLRGVHCRAAQVIIVNGSQQALDLSARILLDEGDEAWIEDPGYIGARGAFLSAGARLVPVPVDEQGISVREGEKRSANARVAYVTPSHQFPLGIVMSLARRLELLEWASRRRAWIIEDDYDSEFRYDGKPLSALQGLDRENRVIYVGTFSKVMFPSLRLGYLVVPPDLVETFTNSLAFTAYHVPVLEQLALTDFIGEGHFSRHIRRMRALYAERQEILLAEINKKLRDFLGVEKEVAGMHLIGWLKNDFDDQTAAKTALEHGVFVPPLKFFCVREKLPDGLLIGYTGVSPKEIRTGVERLENAFKSLLKP